MSNEPQVKSATVVACERCARRPAWLVRVFPGVMRVLCTACIEREKTDG